MESPDKSNGYEEVTADDIGGRGEHPSGIGASVVAEWSKTDPICCVSRVRC